MGGKKKQKRQQKSPASPPKSGSINRLGLIVSIVAITGLISVLIFLGPPESPPEPSPGADALSAMAQEQRPETSAVDEWKAAAEQDIPVSADRDFIRGPRSAAVQIVEFSDFQCPFCRSATQVLDVLLAQYPDDVQLVYKNLPLDVSCNDAMNQELHADACQAAVMARCAGATSPDDFWRVHDALFTSSSLRAEALMAIASELGLDIPGLESCAAGGAALAEVRQDIALALELGLSSTPSIFVNGRMAPSYAVDKLTAIIESIISD